MVRFDMPRSKTNDVRGKKDIRIKTTKAVKKGFTVALAATATGEKLPGSHFLQREGWQSGCASLASPRHTGQCPSACNNKWMADSSRIPVVAPIDT